MHCERCGECCQDFAVLITFSDVIRILRTFPEYSLRSIAQIFTPPKNYPEEEFLSKYPQISILDENSERKGYLIINWNPDKWNSSEKKIMCTFYDPTDEKCRIHGHHPRTCQAYPFMNVGDIVDRPNRRCPNPYSVDISNSDVTTKILQNLDYERQLYWKESGNWNLRPPKKRTWRDLALHLRQNNLNKKN